MDGRGPMKARRRKAPCQMHGGMEAVIFLRGFVVVVVVLFFYFLH